MTRHLVILARAPQPGRVKRRLAHDIGTLEAARFYRAMLADLLSRMTNRAGWYVWLFVTPDTALRHPAWHARGRRLSVQPQGPGDLGRRMLKPFRILPPGPVVLVGSDIPAMRPSSIAQAFRLLAENELVFGPASDGGFWLIGARRRRPLPADLFADVRWSSRHALADTLRNIAATVQVGLAETLDDIDTADDLRAFLIRR